MRTTKAALLIVLGVIGVATAIAFTLQDTIRNNHVTNKETSLEYTIHKTWKLPEKLNEISGIAYLPDGTIASVQDEDGIIFIYDLNKNNIVKEIPFAGAGDYEGIAVYKNDAYVMRSDGMIFEIKDFLTTYASINKMKVRSFKTDFSSKNNMETITIDPKDNSLIITPKEKDFSDDYKGLYKIPIDFKTINSEPIIKISMNDKALKNYQHKKIHKTLSPSDMAIHPKTNEYYIIEGKKQKLLIMDRKGTIKKVYKLHKNDFPQPEGITFSPDGILYISNEANNNAANIVEVSFK